MLGCDGEAQDDPDKKAILMLFAQAIIGSAQTGAFAESLMQIMGKLGGLPVIWVQPKKG